MYGNPLWSPDGNPYVPWDLSFIYQAIANIFSNFGNVFNIGIYLFLMISGIILIFNIVRRLTSF